jgi:hypothetical protein
MLVKGIPNNFKDKSILHPNMRINSDKLCMLDYKYRVRDNGIIPIIHSNNFFFVSINSFIQNNIIIGKKVRKNVSNILTNFKGLTLGIGGESYMYMKSGHFISNSKSIINDCINNTNTKYMWCSHVNYNNINIDIMYNNIIINLSSLNSNLLNQINKRCKDKILIISCKHGNFWHKIKRLTNFKIKKRIQFPDFKLGYFITVTLLEKIK